MATATRAPVRQWWAPAATGARLLAHIVPGDPELRRTRTALCGEIRATWQPVERWPGTVPRCQACLDLARREAVGIAQHPSCSLGHLRPAATAAAELLSEDEARRRTARVAASYCVRAGLGAHALAGLLAVLGVDPVEARR